MEPRHAEECMGGEREGHPCLCGLDQLRAGTMSEKNMEKAREIAPPHFDCEDPWYSCPLSEDGCANDSVPKDECWCPRESLIEKVARALDEAEEQRDTARRAGFKAGYYVGYRAGGEAMRKKIEEAARRQSDGKLHHSKIRNFPLPTPEEKAMTDKPPTPEALEALKEADRLIAFVRFFDKKDESQHWANVRLVIAEALVAFRQQGAPSEHRLLREDWEPLPQRVKDYIAAIETNADPAGTVREAWDLRQQRDYARQQGYDEAKEQAAKLVEFPRTSVRRVEMSIAIRSMTREEKT